MYVLQCKHVLPRVGADSMPGPHTQPSILYALNRCRISRSCSFTRCFNRRETGTATAFNHLFSVSFVTLHIIVLVQVLHKSHSHHHHHHALRHRHYGTATVVRHHHYGTATPVCHLFVVVLVFMQAARQMPQDEQIHVLEFSTHFHRSVVGTHNLLKCVVSCSAHALCSHRCKLHRTSPSVCTARRRYPRAGKMERMGSALWLDQRRCHETLRRFGC